MVPLTVVRLASQGLTVCRSEEATSNGWPAISARAKSETRCWATSGEPAGVRSDVSPAPTAKPRTAKEAAIASARLSSHGAPPKRHDRRGRGCGRLRRGSRRSGRRQRRDAVGKRLRGRFTRRVTTDRVTQRCEAPVLGGEGGIVAQLALELERAHGVEFAVQGGVESQKPLVGVAVGHASASSLKVLASMARARASRDITVPTGVSVASAISR